MLVKPTVHDLLEEVGDNRYALVIMTSKRARQIADGSPVLTKEKDTSPVTLAADEIVEGKVKKINDEYDDEEKAKEEFKNEKRNIL